MMPRRDALPFSRAPRRPIHRQRGVVLLIALIVLVALMLASVSLVRSVDTANVIAGNLAFKQATVQAADFGIEAAVAALPTIVGAADTEAKPDTSGPPNYWYYPTRRVADASGVPTNLGVDGTGTAEPIDWAKVPVAATPAGGNTVKVVIDRLCAGPTPVLDPVANCFHEASADGGSQSINKQVFTAVTMVYYRVTVQVTGPRNTVSMVQAILGL
jgi:Tfp pilus assembly protein PilX